MLRVKALGPCTIAGFHTLLRGEECDVPDDRREQIECLRRVGRVELLQVKPVAAEPSGKDAPSGSAESSSPAPAALPEDLEALEAELAAALEASPTPPATGRPPRPLYICVCGKSAPEHAKGKARLDDSFCGGLKRFMERAQPAAAQ